MAAVAVQYERKPYLRLSDAMVEVEDKDEQVRGTTKQRRISERADNGFRYQRCGGGWRVVRKQRRGE